MKTLIYLFLFVISFNTLNAAPRIDTYLQAKMNESRSDEMIPIYIVFQDKLKLADFNDIPYDTPKHERRRIVIERLQNFANMHQSDVRSYLASQEVQRNAEKYEVLWLANTLILKAKKDVINSLVTRFNNIDMIAYDPEYPVEMLRDVNMTPTPFMTGMSTAAIEPGIVLMNADDCWNLGNRGEGVVVANSDDGFWWKHPDLVKGIYQNLGEDANGNGMTIIFGSGTSSVFDPGDVNGVDNDGNGKVDDLIGWDFSTNNYNVTADAHGSATLGHVTGDGTGGTQTGVAPKAKSLLMRNVSGQSQQWLAFQYAVQMGADVITSSLSWKWNPSTGNPAPPDYSMFRTVTDASLAAGVVHTNSTSNDGLLVNSSRPIPANISTAGNVPAPWIHPDQLKVGGIGGVIGVGNVHVSTDVINNDSPYGPSTWGNWSLFGAYSYTIDPNHRDYPYSRTAPVETPDSMGLIKPDVSAPGQNSISTYVSSGTGYGTFGGTSSATPHTAGCVALMLSINPEMLPQDVAKVIMLTAVEKGAPGKDNRYGTGRIDALAATTSPKFTVTGITGPNNMVINTTLAASDTARELAGLKIATNVNPKIGSLKMLKFGMVTTATSSHITSFDLYYDKNKDNVVSNGDVKLRSLPFQTGPLTFDDLKFKFLDSSRTLILAARTTGSASSGQTVNLGITDTNQVVAYYTTRPFATNFPFGSVTGISGNEVQTLKYNLSQNYPNPFNPSTIINYTLAKDGMVKIKIFDVLGKEVATLVNGVKTAGNYQVEFDATGYNHVSSGIYYYRIEAGDFTDLKKMILVK